ncbi:hypothetical protein BGZ70_003881 [Mortierella alpina]|uniref:Zn(2)-C6 fungal-type domain-containing protein n=1 Tax=Mortierella alpina TaxID=64518 RepID=A0A9P6M4X2_MORAP|nr:hypothetical protein BGZ70_003881 [Mortierella alpina]
MATSTLQLLPSANDIAQLDPASLAAIPGVAYDLKRLKVYSSCLRCRAKKVKCDRKEPCSRCEKHSVECSYRELASVQLDIRQFQRHLNNPKIRKDGAGIITSTATPSAGVHPSSASTSPSLSPARGAYSPPALEYSTQQTLREFTDIEGSPSRPAAIDRARVLKVHRRKPSSKSANASEESCSEPHCTRMDLRDITRDISEQVDRVRLSESEDRAEDTTMAAIPSAHPQHDNADVPIWRAQAIGKHKQTVHEQDLAETFGLAAYLKAKEMEISQDPGRAGQTIDYEMELERALAQRMPTSFSRPERSFSRARKNGLSSAHSSSTPYARPSHCQLAPLSSLSSSGANASKSSSKVQSASSTASAQPPAAAQCCCQIAAQQGQALGSCPYSNVSHAGYENQSVPSSPAASSSQSPSIGYEDTPRIAYSPSYSPGYKHTEHEDAPSSPATGFSQKALPPQIKTWSPSYSTILPPLSISPSSHSSSSMNMDVCSPRMELPPIRLLPLSTSDRPTLVVGRDDEEPVQIECKYNEPNVDAWDMIEKPISRTVPVTTKRGRSVKMEMGWILT